MSRTRNHPRITSTGHRLTATAIAGAVLLAACGSTGETAVGESAPGDEPRAAEPAPVGAEVTDPPETAPPTTAAPAQTELTSPPAEAFTKTTDVVYLTTGDTEFAMDIYTPAGDGPWPVVLNFHGIGSKNDAATTVVSEAAATEGLLVYTPSWVGDSFPFDSEVFDAWKDRASCSVAFAQEHAATNGGDPANTVLYGFSAGVGPVMFASQQPRTEPIEGCATDAAPTPPVGAILGDGPYFLHDSGFDEPFTADPTGMQQEVAALVDPVNWPPDLDAEFFMWIPENDTAPRPIEDSEDWLTMRDPDGSIQADLDQLGMLDDGFISNRDAAYLFELRLTKAGLDVTLDEYPGSHTTADKVSELVGYMQSALDR